MTRVLVTGGTGTLGGELVPRLQEVGYTARIASRRPGEETGNDATEWAQVDLADGTGLEAALADVDVVVHAATKPFPPYRGPRTVDVAGTRRLVDRSAREGVDHLIYVSIVGIDEMPNDYYRAKREAEAVVADGEVPHTILRATQFHALLDGAFRALRWSPVWPLPGSGRLQPVAAGEVAERLVDLVAERPGGRPDPVGGPDVESIPDLAREWHRARGVRRPIVSLPAVGRTLSRLAEGQLTAPDHATGTVSWSEWLRRTD